MAVVVWVVITCGGVAAEDERGWYGYSGARGIIPGNDGRGGWCDTYLLVKNHTRCSQGLHALVTPGSKRTQSSQVWETPIFRKDTATREHI